MAVPANIAAQSAEALAVLKAFLGNHPASLTRLRLCGEQPGSEPQIAVPTKALALLVEVLDHLARGNPVTVAPAAAELSPREAADLLNVPPSYLLKLLDNGELPHRGVGDERRVRLDDLLVYKRRELARRRRILAELTAEAQEMGLDY